MNQTKKIELSQEIDKNWEEILQRKKDGQELLAQGIPPIGSKEYEQLLNLEEQCGALYTNSMKLTHQYLAMEQ